MAELTTCDRDCRVLKAENIYCLVLSGSLSTAGLTRSQPKSQAFSFVAALASLSRL